MSRYQLEFWLIVFPLLVGIGVAGFFLAGGPF